MLLLPHGVPFSRMPYLRYPMREYLQNWQKLLLNNLCDIYAKMKFVTTVGAAEDCAGPPDFQDIVVSSNVPY